MTTAKTSITKKILLSANKHAVVIKFIVTSIHISTLDIKKITVERERWGGGREERERQRERERDF
jgi:hypothetical protein